mgnify:CR=1 FL=1
MKIRVGFGFDVHRLVEGRELWLGGIRLARTVDLIAEKGWRVGNIDATVCAERPKLKARIPEMQEVLAHVMGVEADDVSIKATTTEKLGFTGREEGISAYATVLIEKD